GCAGTPNRWRVPAAWGATAALPSVPNACSRAFAQSAASSRVVTRIGLFGHEPKPAVTKPQDAAHHRRGRRPPRRPSPPRPTPRRRTHPYIKWGRLIRFDPDDIERWLDAGGRPA